MRKMFPWAFAAVLFFTGLATDASDKPGFTDEATYERAPVTIDGHKYFQVRGVSAYPAKMRAETIAKRIRGVASDRSIALDSLRVVEEADRSGIFFQDRLILYVLEEDAALEGVSRGILTEVIHIKVSGAVIAYRNERRPEALLKKFGYALGATFIVALFLYILSRVFRWLRVSCEARLKSKLEGLQVKSHHLLRADRLWKFAEGMLQTTQIIFMLATFFLYCNYVLGLFPWSRAFEQNSFAMVIDPARIMGRKLLEAIPGLVFIAILVVVTRYFLKLKRLFFASIDDGTIQLAGFEREWAWPTYRLLRLLIIILAVVIAYPYIPGSGSPAFKGMSIFLGVVFSLGSSSFLSNMVAGYLMTYRRAFKVGDRIRIDNMTGDVLEIRLLVTHLRTIKNEEIVVPNSMILTTPIVNYSTHAKTRGVILHTTVGIGYETPWRQVEAMLLDAAKRTTGILKDPQAFVLQRELGDFAIKYELNVYSDSAQGMAVLYTELHRNILDAFNEQGVQIMTPAYEGDPEMPKVVPKEKWFEGPAGNKKG